jgi:hypothetical protein
MSSCGVTGTLFKRMLLRIMPNLFLQELIVNLNRIGDDGAVILADLLRANTTLHTLNCASNQIGDRGLAAFAVTLRLNVTLTHFDVSGNSGSASGNSALNDAVDVNDTLVTYAGPGQLLDLEKRQAQRSIYKQSGMFEGGVRTYVVELG